MFSNTNFSISSHDLTQLGTEPPAGHKVHDSLLIEPKAKAQVDLDCPTVIKGKT